MILEYLFFNKDIREGLMKYFNENKIEYIDTEDGSIVIPQEEVPLATKPTVKTTRSTKRTVKKSKLKKKSMSTAKS